MACELFGESSVSTLISATAAGASTNQLLDASVGHVARRLAQERKSLKRELERLPHAPPSHLSPLKVPASPAVAPPPPVAADAAAAGATSPGKAGKSQSNAAAPKRTRIEYPAPHVPIALRVTKNGAPAFESGPTRTAPVAKRPLGLKEQATVTLELRELERRAAEPGAERRIAEIQRLLSEFDAGVLVLRG